TIYKHYEKDIDLLVETGHTVFLTSIQWSRLIPTGTGEINQEAVSFYLSVFSLVRAKGIQLFVNLYKFDLTYFLKEK
ncbi:family 1 glycosylhydrolase, partial [Streptococcus suis]